MASLPLPEGTIKVKISYVISVIVLLVSMGVGWGGYRAGFNQQATQIEEARKDIVSLRSDLATMHADFAALQTSVDDLKNTIIFTNGQTTSALARRPPINVTVNNPTKK